MRLEKLQKKHDAEKAAAQNELQQLKKQFDEKEKKISGEFVNKYNQIRTQIEDMNNKFAEKLKSYEQLNQTLQQSLSSNQSNSSQAIDDIRAKYEKEIASTIQSSNEKYNALVVENIQAMEKLKKEQEDKLASLEKALRDQFSSDKEQALGQLRATLNGEKQMELVAAKHEFQDQLNKLKSEHSERTNALIQDHQHTKQSFEQLQQSSEQTIQNLTQQIQRLSQQLSSNTDSLQTQLTQLLSDNTAKQQDIIDLQIKLTQAQEENTSLSSLIKSKNQSIVEKDAQLTTLQGQYDALLGEMNKNQEVFHKKLSDINNNVLSLQEEKKKLMNEQTNLLHQIQQLTQDYSKEKNTWTLESQAKDSKYQQLFLEFQQIQKQHQDQLQNNLQSNTSSNIRIQQLNEELSQLNTKYQQEIEALNKKYQDQLQSKQQQAQQDKDNHLKELQILKQQSANELQALQLKYQELQSSLESQNKSLVENYQAEKAQMQQTYENKIQEQQLTIDELTNNIKYLQENFENEKLSLNNNYNKLDNKYKTLSKEYDTKKKDYERNESINNSLKQQIENLREEIKNAALLAQEKHQNNVSSLINEYEAKIKQLTKELQDEAANTQKALQQQYEQEKFQMMTSHQDEIQALKSLLTKENASYNSQLIELEKIRNSLEATIKTNDINYQQQLSQLKSQHQQEINRMKEDHRTELNDTNKSLTTKHEKIVQDLKNSHQEQSEKLQSDHKALIEHQESQHQGKINTLTQDHHEDLKVKLTSLAQDWANKLNEALLKARQGFDQEQNQQKLSYEQQLESKQQNIQSLQYELQCLQQERKSLQDTISSERTERQRREEFFIKEKDDLNFSHGNELRKEKENYEKKIMQIMSRHEEDMKIFKVEHLETRNKYEERLREVAKEYKALEERYLARESRPEDLQKIALLSDEINSLNEEVQKTKEEMAYFKREMLNREENYNQKFSRQPNVGVMNVIKPKESAEQASFGRKQTQMRVINTQGGNALPGMPTMNVGLMDPLAGMSAKSKK